jgi:hypothetical protein
LHGDLMGAPLIRLKEYNRFATPTKTSRARGGP